MQDLPTWRRLGRLAFYLGVAGLIAVSLMPGKSLPRLHGLDMLYHALAYAGLSALAIAGHPQTRRAGIAMAALVVIGVLLEFAQNAVPGRSGSIGDAVANAVGTSVIAAAWWIWLLRHRSVRRH
jgi:VanZ family protein